jgi:hypothetical protein
MRPTIKAVCVGLWCLAAGAACMGDESTTNREPVTVALTLPGGAVATVGVTPGEAPGYVSSVKDGQMCEVAVSSDGMSASTVAVSAAKGGEGSLVSEGSEGSLCSQLGATVQPDAMGNGSLGDGQVSQSGISAGCCLDCGSYYLCGTRPCCLGRCCSPQ